MYTTSVIKSNEKVQVFNNCTITVYNSKTTANIQNKKEELQDKLANEVKRLKEELNKIKESKVE